MILNKKGVFNRCAVPELAVKYESKMREDEWSKFKEVQERPETGRCLEDMVTAREEGKKRKKEEMEIRKGKGGRRRYGVVTMGRFPGVRLAVPEMGRRRESSSTRAAQRREKAAAG